MIECSIVRAAAAACAPKGMVNNKKEALCKARRVATIQKEVEASIFFFERRIKIFFLSLKSMLKHQRATASINNGNNKTKSAKGWKPKEILAFDPVKLVSFCFCFCVFVFFFQNRKFFAFLSLRFVLHLIFVVAFSYPHSFLSFFKI